jgi:predicted SnoaL-like aldol condensation-catalyzing enzyme
MSRTITPQASAADIKLSNKAKAKAILNCLETRDAVGPSYISDARYIQHNLMIKDDKPGFLTLQSWLPQDFSANIIRTFADGEYVFLHVGYDMGGPTVGMDIFRFEDGKAVEHWDNLQSIPATASFESMTSGAVDALNAGDRAQTEANKNLAYTYIQRVHLEGRHDKIGDFIDLNRYRDHHPDTPETIKYEDIHLVLGEGNFCLVQTEGTVDGSPAAFNDLFRIENGKIVEHWDTAELIPAKEAWQNNNGKF